jgi:hypothetical protein
MRAHQTALNLQAEEVEREKSLILAGKMPAKEASKELMEHPVFKISQLTRSIIEEKERKVSGVEVEWRSFNVRRSAAFAKGHSRYLGWLADRHNKRYNRQPPALLCHFILHVVYKCGRGPHNTAGVP